MTPVIDPIAVEAPLETDLATAVQRVLAASAEPMTLSKTRARLPAAYRDLSLEELGDCLRRLVAANVVYQYPRYRSAQDRFWDRPMPVHIAALLREALQEGPLAWAALRRKLPAYALVQAESVLLEQASQGLLHRHPRGKKRGGDRFGLAPADPKEYLRSELALTFHNLESLGFTPSQLRAGALELLHDEEWSPALPLNPDLPAATDEPASAAAGGAAPAIEPTHL
jgi:hypothetical protein